MNEYHLYLLEHGGRIVERVDLSCPDDGTALELSRERVPGGQEFELWQGIRRLYPPQTAEADWAPSPPRSAAGGRTAGSA